MPFQTEEYGKMVTLFGEQEDQAVSLQEDVASLPFVLEEVHTDPAIVPDIKYAKTSNRFRFASEAVGAIFAVILKSKSWDRQKPGRSEFACVIIAQDFPVSVCVFVLGFTIFRR
jgi:hypothetical protein